MVMVIVTLAFCAAAFDAEAFEMRTTALGDPVRWNTVEIEITLDPNLDRLGPFEEVEDAIIQAFDAWGDSAELPLIFDFSRGECGGPEYVDGGENANCISADNVPRGGDGHAGATTWLTFKDRSGDIVDGDIVFNTEAGEWSLDGRDGTLHIGAAALHEVGHLLGMKHSEIEDARMAPILELSGEDGSSLHTDDVLGAVEIYATWGGFLSTGGCSAAPVAADGSRPASLAGFTLLLGLLALLVARRARRRAA